jgi:aminopeptidase YwaD
MLQKDHLQKSSARALDLTRRLVDQFGPRPAGSDASAKCAVALQETAEGFADRTWTETFTMHPGAFLGWIRVLVIVYAVSVACLWAGIPLAAALPVTAGLAVMVAQFFLYRETLDPFFPRKTGVNVFASIDRGRAPCTGP